MVRAGVMPEPLPIGVALATGGASAFPVEARGLPGDPRRMVVPAASVVLVAAASASCDPFSCAISPS
jgi:hypothetical protein